MPVGGLSAFARPNNGAFRSLYNGNIAGMSVNNAGLSRASSGVNALPLFYRYEYDQLNRLLRMRTYKGMNNSTNAWTPVAINDYKEDVVYDPNGNILSYNRNGAPELSQPPGMDSLDYEYYTNTNRLKRVVDSVNSTYYTEDIDNQADAENYVYDAIGNLIEDKAEGITAINWNVYGKIKSITKAAGTIRYTYDAAGNRIAKMFNGDTTLYVRDASGNVLSVYTKQSTGPLEQAEVHLYGSSRLGMTSLRTATDSVDIALDGDYGYAKELTFTRGEKIFELSNHLGNVLVTISDRRLATDNGNGEIAWYEADVVTANDYYPFGMGMPGRKYAADGAYRYGFNGKENDNDVKGEGNQQDYGMRIYDPRLGRFLSTDPITKDYPMLTPFQFASNTPIWAIDIDGLEGFASVTCGVRGVSGKMMIQGDVNGDMVVDASERDAWMSAIGIHMTVALSIHTAGRSTSLFLWLANPVNQGVFLTVGGFVLELVNPDPGYNINIPGPGDEVARAFKLLFKTKGGKLVEAAFEESASFASDSEVKWFGKLLDEGKDVELLAEKANKEGDFLVSGVKTELKTISGVKNEAEKIAQAVNDRIKRASKQAGSIILDLSDQEGATLEIVKKGLAKYWGQGSDKLIRVVGKDFDATFKKSDFYPQK